MIFTVRNDLFLVFCLLFESSAPAAGLSLHHHLDPGTGRLASGEIHLELMDSYRRISSYSTNVGRAIMSRDKFGDPGYEEDRSAACRR